MEERWMGSVGDQWCWDIKIKCFCCYSNIVIFHVQVEVNVEFSVNFQLMVQNS